MYYRARLDLGAESPNWRDHPNDHSKTAVPIHVNETVCQFLYNGMWKYQIRIYACIIIIIILNPSYTGWYEHESKVATIGGKSCNHCYCTSPVAVNVIHHNYFTVKN